MLRSMTLFPTRVFFPEIFTQRVGGHRRTRLGNGDPSICAGGVQERNRRSHEKFRRHKNFTISNLGASQFHRIKL
jgi:hypothetical protein